MEILFVVVTTKYNNALLWRLTVKTTFRLLSMSISLGKPLLPHRTM